MVTKDLDPRQDTLRDDACFTSGNEVKPLHLIQIENLPFKDPRVASVRTVENEF